MALSVLTLTWTCSTLSRAPGLSACEQWGLVCNRTSRSPWDGTCSGHMGPLIKLGTASAVASVIIMLALFTLLWWLPALCMLGHVMLQAEQGRGARASHTGSAGILVTHAQGQSFSGAPARELASAGSAPFMPCRGAGSTWGGRESEGGAGRTWRSAVWPRERSREGRGGQPEAPPHGGHEGAPQAPRRKSASAPKAQATK